MEDQGNMTLRELVIGFLKAEKEHPDQKEGELQIIVGDGNDANDIEIVVRRPRKPTTMLISGN